MAFLRSAGRRLGIAGELLAFFVNQRWWILPLIVLILLVGVVIVVGETTSLAPFIYTMF
jgi:hypothetical protein